MVQITYQKRDGSIMQRYRNTDLPYKIGDETSMGWKVLNIEYKYNNNYYPVNEYNVLINKDKQKVIKRKQTREMLLREFKTFMYYCIALEIINLLKFILGI